MNVPTQEDEVRTVTLAVALLLLAGCSADGPEGAEVGYQDDLADALADGPETTDMSVTHPDGLTIRLGTVEQVPSSWAHEVPSGHTVVRITVELDNGGSQPVPLESPIQHMQLLHGPNLAEAGRADGYMTDDPEQELTNSMDLPRQVGVGQTVPVVYSFEVPDDEMDELSLEVTVEPDRYPPHTFQGVTVS